MNNNNTQSKTSNAKSPTNEKAGFQFSSFLKITDPKTNKVILQQRCS